MKTLLILSIQLNNKVKQYLHVNAPHSVSMTCAGFDGDREVFVIYNSFPIPFTIILNHLFY